MDYLDALWQVLLEITGSHVSVNEFMLRLSDAQWAKI